MSRATMGVLLTVASLAMTGALPVTAQERVAPEEVAQGELAREGRRIAPTAPLGESRGVASAAGVELDEEEQALDRALERAHVEARRWHRAWSSVFALSVLNQTALTYALERESRAGRLAQAFGILPPATGLVLQLADPLAALELHADRVPLEAEADRAARIRAKRALLRRYARSEAGQRNWFAHVGPLFLNTLVAGVQLFAFDEPLMAALQLGVGVGLSQLKVWTAPRAASRALEAQVPQRPMISASVGAGVAALQVTFVGAR